MDAELAMLLRKEQAGPPANSGCGQARLIAVEVCLYARQWRARRAGADLELRPAVWRMPDARPRDHLCHIRPEPKHVPRRAREVVAEREHQIGVWISGHVEIQARVPDGNVVYVIVDPVRYLVRRWPVEVKPKESRVRVL